LRYPTAIEFGRDLYKAVEAMEDGGLMVAHPMLPGDSAPATRVASPALSPPPTPRPKRRATIPIVAGIAALLFISAALYGPILKMNRQSQAAADSVPSTPPSQPQRDTAQHPVDRSSNPTGAISTALDVDKELSTAETEAKRDKPSARAALQRLAALTPRLDAAGDVARAALIKFEAYVTLDDTPKACAALNDVKDRARGTSYQRKVDDRLLACQ